MQNVSRIKGFTLIELLVVISIISLLSSVVLSSLNSARSKARDAKRRLDIEEIQKALEVYHLANGSYPSTSWAESNNPTTWATLQGLLSPYIKTLPHDPIEASTGNPYAGARAYGYFSSNVLYGCPGQYYILVYTLETAAGPHNYPVDSCAGDVNNFSFNYGGNAASTTTHTVGVPGR